MKEGLFPFLTSKQNETTRTVSYLENPAIIIGEKPPVDESQEGKSSPESFEIYGFLEGNILSQGESPEKEN